MKNSTEHGQFEYSLIRGTKIQANANPSKAVYLAEYLKSNNVDSMEELTAEQLITLNVGISRVEHVAEVETSNAFIGAMIETDRANGKYYGQD